MQRSRHLHDYVEEAFSIITSSLAYPYTLERIFDLHELKNAAEIWATTGEKALREDYRRSQTTLA